MRHASRYILMGLLIAGATWASAAMAATTTLKNISYDALPGGSVELHMDFGDGPVPQPKIFTTGNPPRIAVDFADTDNAAPRHLDIGKGSTSGVSAVAAGGRTRVVVELMRESSYRSRVEGNSLVLTVNNGSTDQSVTTASTIDPTKALPSSAAGPAISNIDFRRGPNGEGRVLIDFSGSGANAEMTRKGDKVLVTIDHANLPANLAQRLDTLDFATPVQSIVTRAGMGGGARMEIAVKGNVETSAYQTADQYVVEVAPKKADASKDAKLARLGQEPSYNGKRVTFNFQDIPVRSALQLIADISGLNLVASDSVGGSVTLRLVNVPWDQALDVILRAKSLDKRRNGNVVWVAPQAELAKYEQDLADAKLKAQDTAELITDYVPISYGKASDIAKLLTSGSMQGGGGSSGGNTQRGFLSPRGSVSFDERTNTLLLNDTPEKIRQLRELIAVLDKPVQQVLIESRIVVASDDFTRELGAKFGVNGRINNTEFQNAAAATPALTAGLGGGNVTSGGLNVNLPVTPAAGSFGLAILGANYAIDLELSAAQTEGRGEVISSPRVITANQQEAVIRQGQEIGYVTFQNSAGSGAGSGTATVQFKDAVLELKVTPTITADNRVYLMINVKKDALAGYVDAPGSGKIPTIDTREINTSVLVDNGQTVVLGGIYEINKANTMTKVPGLGDIPGVGVLFRKTSRTNTKAELLIFVTPRILSDTLQ
ncbi:MULTISPECIES: type IV pilus secretin PilQ [Rhodanobacter]|uniref:type IV pilus secretin PilQ n=1 Tax=Rhodanobacter TaxID=75309 RepID=UPI00026106B7|nr:MULTISPECIES: type IV pilus secretin PilQ [Rhodanobacter]EIM03606.1 type IV pilus secretin PilQ/competence protein [Rhodanobacter denitrificans]KZC19080.1 fimbrial protein [Rhodanobacter denitrificans]UJJ50498.1 type IV pilus secretin PilQ [Rhodanobacter denitrificans]UJJ57317.1 type IV pilus secretin PilQ [Rhodanobacter denitrificans]UJM91177.1 type IV pilus secretin PilQ [Rhodanobacter denitrificans]